jgi:hypothetical protein
MWTVAGMLAASLGGVFVIAPRIDALRADTRASMRTLPVDDARRVTFGRLHGLSTVLAGLTVVAGLGLMWTEMRDPH